MTLPFNDKYTPVPNILFDLMPHISMAQFAVLATVARKAYGWQKAEDQISLSQFVEATGLSLSGTRQAIAALLLSGFLVRRKSGKQDHYYTIDLQYIERYLGRLKQKAERLNDAELCHSVTQLEETMSLSNTELCHSVAQSDDELCHSVAPQKKELKEKEIKESVFSSFSFSSVSTPDEDIAQALQQWQNIVGGNVSKSNKTALRQLCAKHGAKQVVGAIDKSHAAGKVDGLGYVRWLLDNAATQLPPVAVPAPDVLPYRKWLLREYLCDNPQIIAQDEGVAESKLQGEYEKYKLGAQGYKVVQVPGLYGAMAAAVGGNGPVGTYTGPAENLP